MKPRPFLGLIALTAAMVAGCVNLTKESPPVRRYMMDVARPEKAEPPDGAPVLAVLRLEPVPAYSGKEFVYRTGEFTYETDYYNQFLEEPATAVTLAAQGWLADCGLFGHVLAGGTGVESRYVLKGNLLALYGDYRRADRPMAVVILRFLLLEGSGLQARIVLQRDYAEEVEAGDGSPAALVAAWSKGVAHALRALGQDVADQLGGRS